MTQESNINRPKLMIRSIVVPANIYAAATRANSHLMDLTVFGKLRSFCSLEDIAVYCALNNHLTVNGTPIASSQMKNIMTIGDGNQAEFNGIINNMSKTEEIKKLAMAGIESFAAPMSSMLALASNSGTAEVVKDTSVKNTLTNIKPVNQVLPYQLKTSGSNVFVVVGTGFDKYVGARSERTLTKTFVQDFLKLCDGLYSPSEVARHPLFKSFLIHLQS
jgi:hypothetical protein